MRIAVFCMPGLQHFINPIADALQENHVVQKVYSVDSGIVLDELNKADVIWLEWGNELAMQLTNTALRYNSSRKVILRIHSYEILEGYLEAINWDAVDEPIFVNRWMRDIFRPEAHYIPNGVNLDEYICPANKEWTNKVAFLANINHKKGFQLLLQIFMALEDHELHIGGNFQDMRFKYYLEHLNLPNVHYDGYIENNQEWFEDKSYIICTSPWESQGMGIMEGMACGLKPIVHVFPGADSIYPKEYLWRKISEVKPMLQKPEPLEYRKFIGENYSFEKQMEKVESLL